MYRYVIYDLKVISYFELSGITQEEFFGEADLVIDRLESYSVVVHEKNMYFENDTRLYLEQEYIVLERENEWKLCIYKKGNLILLNQNCKNLQGALSILLGTGLSATMMYRGRIPLHASAFVLEDYVIGMMGRSGVGKSTILRLALQKGFKVITEDTLLIENNDNPYSIPSRNIKSKLKQDAIDFLKIDRKHIGDYIEKSDKYWVGIPYENRCLEKKVLKSIYILNPQNKNGYIFARELKGSEKFSRILDNTICIRNLPRQDAVKIVRTLQSCLKRIIVYELSYPLGKEYLNDIIKVIIRNENTGIVKGD